MFNVFLTQLEADIALESDDEAFIASICEACVTYKEVTVRWGKVRQRDSDGKFIYSVCPTGSQEHTQESYQSDWFIDE